MIDKVKRQTLKRIGVSALAATTVGITGHSLAFVNTESGVSNVLADALELADIEVSTRVSAIGNDLEVLITNVGKQKTTITQLTPSVTMTRRGQFDFSELMKDGSIALTPGQSISVPMRPHTVQLSGNETATQQGYSLSEALRRSMSVVTENNSFAKITVFDSVQFI